MCMSQNEKCGALGRRQLRDNASKRVKNRTLQQVTNNTKALMALDQLLLERLSANTGNLLDDEELIGELVPPWGTCPLLMVLCCRCHVVVCHVEHPWPVQGLAGSSVLTLQFVPNAAVAASTPILHITMPYHNPASGLCTGIGMDNSVGQQQRMPPILVICR